MNKRINTQIWRWPDQYDGPRGRGIKRLYIIFDKSPDYYLAIEKNFDDEVVSINMTVMSRNTKGYIF